ncbi:MAG: formate dehydrogenase subunit gamma, partial [Rhodospirillales bacterium]
MTIAKFLRRGLAVAVLAALAAAFAPGTIDRMEPGKAAVAQQQGTVPGNTQGISSDADFWRMIKGGGVQGGIQGNVSIPDKKAGMLVQAEGEEWRALRNGPLKEYGGYALGAVVLVLLLFFLVRGRIKIDAGFSG